MASAGLFGTWSSRVAFGSSEVAGLARVGPIPPVSHPEKWDQKADVVVVGGGGAGLCAAVRARMKGASVILVEIMPSMGGATQHATGAVGWGTKAQKRAGIPFNREDLFQMVMQSSNYTINPWLLRSLIHKGAETLDWIEDLGLEWEVQVCGMMPAFHVPKGAMNRSWLLIQKEVTDLLFKVAKEKGVKPLVKTRTVALVRKNDRIVGIKAEREGETLFIMAKKGVILAAGGMSVNRGLLKEYIPAAYRGCASSYDLPTSTGEVIRMGIGAGADMAGFNSVSVFDGGIPYLEEGKGPFYRYLYSGDIQLVRQPWLYVNKCCQRFLNEDPPGFGFETMGAAQMAQPEGRAYVIFDNNYKKDIWIFKGEYCEKPLVPDLPGMDKWPERICPKDWQIAVKKAIEAGIIKVDPTIKGLANKLGLEPGKLQERVVTYNKFCETGNDLEFGKKKEFLIPIKTPPFYGTKVGAQIASTKCGLRINPDFQVLDRNCRIIPGLYAAFHTAGGSTGENYVGTSVLGDCNLAYASGYAAGDKAASKG